MNLDLSKAYELEAQFLDIAALMSESSDETNNEVDKSDRDFRIRNMTLAIQYIEKEIEEMKHMKSLVVSNWDSKIKEKENNINQIKDYIFNSMKEYEEKTLKSDVSTVSIGKPRVTLSLNELKKEELIETIKSDKNLRNTYELEPEIDLKAYLKDVHNGIKEEAKLKSQHKIEQMKMDDPTLKLTKKREKEIEEETLSEIYDRVSKNVLFVNVNVSDESLSIRKNIKI